MTFDINHRAEANDASGDAPAAAIGQPYDVAESAFPSHAVASAPDPGADGVRKHPFWLTLLEKYGLVLLFAGTMVFFATYPDSSEFFLTSANIQNVLGNQCITITLAVASLLPLISGRFDLSVGANAGLCSIATSAAMSNFQSNLLIAVLAGVTTGVIVGVINGVLISYAKLSSIVVTLATTTIISGVVLAYAKGQIINTDISPTLLDFGALTWLGVPRVVYLAALVCLVGWYLLQHTAFGRHVSMAGRNQAAARLIGIDVDRLTFVSFVIGGFLAGLAGVLMTARTGGANPQSGPDFLFPALTAVFLGATAIRPGEFNVVGTVVGALFLTFAVSGMNIAGLPAYVEPLFNGGALLASVVIYVLARRGSTGGNALAI